ncbi:MAG: LuxR C-terminal-related transcriptional regulator, partial [Bacteroidota bacterium]
ARLAQPTLSDRQKVCHLAVYGQLLIQGERLSEAYPYCKAANDLAVEHLAADDPIRGYAQAAYGWYLDFYQAPELALLPLQQSLPALAFTDPNNTFPYRSVFWATVRIEIELGQLEEAQRHHAMNLALIKARKDTIWLAREINTYGLYLQTAGYHERAIGVFNEGLRLFNAPSARGPLLWYVNLLETKAHSLMATQQFESGIANLKQAYYVRKSFELQDWALQAMGYIIKYLMDQGEYQQAYRFFREEQAFFAAGEGMTKRKYKLYQHLGKLMTHLGHTEEATFYLRDYNDYVANHLFPNAASRVQTPNALSEHILLQQQTQEQAVIINELEIGQLRKEVRLRQYGIAVLGLSLGLLLLTGLWYRGNRRRTERERERAAADRRRILELENENLKYSVATRERDLKRLAADNRLRTKLKRDILKRLEAINRLPATEKEAHLGKLRSEFATTISEQEVISNLQDQVETINAAFEDQLRERIPGITGPEIRYCSLLRLGMNNQQIAQVLNKSDSTIRTYKQRIMQKAGVTGRNALQLLVEQL